MNFEFTGDSDERTKVLEFVCGTSAHVEKAIKNQDYGPGVDSIFLVVLSHPFNSKLNPRRRFTKANKTLWSDVFVPYETMCDASNKERVRIVASAIESEVNELQGKYTNLDFDFKKLSSDLKIAFDPFRESPETINWELIEYPNQPKAAAINAPGGSPWWKFW